MDEPKKKKRIVKFKKVIKKERSLYESKQNKQMYF